MFEDMAKAEKQQICLVNATKEEKTVV